MAGRSNRRSSFSLNAHVETSCLLPKATTRQQEGDISTPCPVQSYFMNTSSALASGYWTREIPEPTSEQEEMHNRTCILYVRCLINPGDVILR